MHLNASWHPRGQYIELVMSATLLKNSSFAVAARLLETFTLIYSVKRASRLTVCLLVAADRPSLRASERSHLGDHQRLQHGNKEGRHQEDHGGRSGLCSPGGQILRVHQVTWQQTWWNASGAAAALLVWYLISSSLSFSLYLSLRPQCGLWDRPGETSSPVGPPVRADPQRSRGGRSGGREKRNIAGLLHLPGTSGPRFRLLRNRTLLCCYRHEESLKSIYRQKTGLKRLVSLGGWFTWSVLTGKKSINLVVCRSREVQMEVDWIWLRSADSKD